MIKLDEKINGDLNQIRETMQSLQSFWVKAGALLDYYDVYTVRVNDDFKLTYDPNEETVDIHECLRGQQDKLVFQHGQGGLKYFNYMLDEVGAVYGAIHDAKKVLNVVTTKAMGISNEFSMEMKTKELSSVVLSLTDMILKKTIGGQASFEKADLMNNDLVLSSGFKGNIGHGNLCLSIDNASNKTQFFKNTPSGDAELILEISPNGKLEFPNHISQVSDRKIIVEACLTEAQVIQYQIKESESLTMDNGIMKLNRKDNDSGMGITP